MPRVLLAIAFVITVTPSLVRAAEPSTQPQRGDGRTVHETTREKRALPERPAPARRRPAATTAPSARAPWSQATDVRPGDLLPEPYRVHPGDVLQVGVYDLVGPGIETVKRYRVDASGAINLPLVGRVPVAGLTEDELLRAVNEAYRRLNLCR